MKAKSQVSSFNSEGNSTQSLSQGAGAGAGKRTRKARKPQAESARVPLLIGYPCAAVSTPWQAPLAVGQSALPSVVFQYHTMDLAGDITGGGKGIGAGAVKLRAARPVGNGVDAEQERAEHEAELLERSPWVAELLAKESELGRVLMVMAGGKSFAEGGAVRFNGDGMAARAARYLKRLRGVEPSTTSLDDAAGAAVLALVKEWACWEYVYSVDALPVSAIADLPSMRKRLSAVAWREAFASMCDDRAAQSGATSGRHASEQGDGKPLALLEGQLAAQEASLQAWARTYGAATSEPAKESDADSRLFAPTAQDRARVEAVSFVWSAIVTPLIGKAGNQRGAAANHARQVDSAIHRASFIIRIIHGKDIPEAARLSGFKDGAAAIKSLGDTRTWATLARAQVDRVKGSPVYNHLRDLCKPSAARSVAALKEVAFWARLYVPTRRDASAPIAGAFADKAPRYYRGASYAFGAQPVKLSASQIAALAAQFDAERAHGEAMADIGRLAGERAASNATGGAMHRKRRVKRRQIGREQRTLRRARLARVGSAKRNQVRPFARVRVLPILGASARVRVLPILGATLGGAPMRNTVTVVDGGARNGAPIRAAVKVCDASTVDIARQLRQALDRYQAESFQARRARARVKEFTQRTAKDWERASRGLRAGYLR